MRITILAVGTLKETYLRDFCAEYLKRLSLYCEVSIKEIKEESIPDKASKAIGEGVKKKEGDRILSLLSPGDFLVALDLNKQEPDSVELAHKLEGWLSTSGSRLFFAIGGSLGLSEEVRKRADASISLSRLTFTHQMSRIILLEQLYRSFRILRNEPYHK